MNEINTLHQSIFNRENHLFVFNKEQLSKGNPSEKTKQKKGESES